MPTTVDTSGVMDALRYVEKNTGRPISKGLNKLALTFVIGAKGVKGAMQLTPKADKSKISQVPPREVAAFVATKLRKEGKKVDSETFKKMVKAEYARRKRAAGYTAYAGWSNAAKAFGGRGVKGVTDSEKKEARHGTGKKATPESLFAELVNTAPAIETIGEEAAQQALDNAVRDQLDYAADQLQKLLNEVQA